jgi:uncharacterized membrane protein
MLVLLVLIISFLVALLISRLKKGSFQPAWAGCMAMCVMLQFTAIGHFLYLDGMTAIVPPFLPFRRELVLLTGIMEIAAGWALLVPRWRKRVAGFLVIFFILLLPANIYASMNHIDYRNGTNTGEGLSYLLFRVPLQVLFIGWTWYFGISVHRHANGFQS